MLALKYLLLAGAIGMFIGALAVLAYDLYVDLQFRRRSAAGIIGAEPEPLRWRTAVALVCLAWAPLLIALSIAVRPPDQSHAIATPPLYASARK